MVNANVGALQDTTICLTWRFSGRKEESEEVVRANASEIVHFCPRLDLFDRHEPSSYARFSTMIYHFRP